LSKRTGFGRPSGSLLIWVVDLSDPNVIEMIGRIPIST
jgi:hypothetical protein